MNDPDAVDETVELKRMVAQELAQARPPVPGQVMAVDWAGAVSVLDGVFDRYLPVLGPLAPPQLAALAALIAQAVALLDQRLNPRTPV